MFPGLGFGVRMWLRRKPTLRRYVILVDMPLRLTIIIATIFFGAASVADAQVGGTVLPVSVPPNSTSTTGGTVDVIVEAATYVPTFYNGRPEPTTGNMLRLIAVPNGAPALNFTYHWSLDGQVLPDTGPVITTQAPMGKNPKLRLVVLTNGQHWAEKTEIIALSEPEVLFYEVNPLRGLGAVALGEEYTLIGDGAEIRAVPYFTSKEDGVRSLRGNWSIDNIDTGFRSDWETMVLSLPEEGQSRYEVVLQLRNERNLAETVSNYFYLLPGI